jgi:hypothetical protein
MKRILLGTIIAATITAGATSTPARSSVCWYPDTIQTVTFNRTKYPNIYQHWLDAISNGWPKILIVEREGTAGRRDRLLRPIPIRAGLDRDEYPPATAREGWLADVEYVPSSENRSQGASLGAQLRGVCNGVRFQFEWTSAARPAK